MKFKSARAQAKYEKARQLLDSVYDEHRPDKRESMTQRATELLREAEVIEAEDVRRSE